MKVIHDGIYPEMQLRSEILGECKYLLDKSTKIRNNIKNKDKWLKLKKEKMNCIKEAFPKILFNRKNALNVKKVSKHEFDDFRIENILFESIPGWEVNATLYLPKEEGKYPAVVCPTGHSSKTYPNYQRSAQIFARNGYIALSFDPPGVRGELAYMNDHFENGVVGYITGIWSKTHFVADAIAALDYLETREDVLKDNGFAVTGVSGGGHTTLMTAVLDDRVSFYAPVCCLSKYEQIFLDDLYTSCPETLGPNFLTMGIENTEYLSLAAPKPCLIVGGVKDEVFDYKKTINIFDQAKHIYEIMGAKEDIDIFLDEESGHGYTAKMANAVVKYMNKYMKSEETQIIEIGEDEILYNDPEKLMCHPSNKVNMFTVNRDEGIRLENTRKYPKKINQKSEYLREKAIDVLGINEEYDIKANKTKEYEGKVSWVHRLQKMEFFVNKNIRVPGLYLNRDDLKKQPVLLFVDEKGKWEGLKQNGFLARSARFLEREKKEGEPSVLSIDVSGFGELEMESAYYDLAGWNDIERIITYLSVNIGKSVMGRRVRDMIAVLNHLEEREDVDEEKIMIGGRGIGAIVALHAALIWKKAYKLICIDMLSQYKSITEIFPYECRQSIVIPNILKYYDLPDIAEIKPAKEVTIINPRDAANKLIETKEAEKIYEKALTKGVNFHCGLSAKNAEDTLVSTVLEE